MEKDLDLNKNISSEKDLDLMQLFKKLWSKKKMIILAGVIGLIVGLVTAFSIPKEYTATVILAPESSSKNSLGGAGALAAMAGINFNASTSEDISPDIYPNIIESTPFVMGVSKMNVTNPKSNKEETLFDYVDNNLTTPWWISLVSLPKKIFSNTKDLQDTTLEKDVKLYLSDKQVTILSTIRDRIDIKVDNKTGVINLSFMMQNPEISAVVADSLTNYLQAYIISYRTQKARADLDFTEKLFKEAKVDYDKAQQKYAEYIDRNQNVILASYRVNQERLQNEAALKYNVYNQVAQQLQVAKVKVQDQTPVYTVIEPSIIPLFPSKPNKKLIIIGFLFASVLVACCYILGKDFLKNQKL